MAMVGEVPYLSKVSSQPAPPGITSNFVNPPSRAGTLIAASAVLIILSTSFVLLRLYTRLFITRFFGLSDCLLLAGYSFAVANTALAVAETTVGLGRHSWDVPLGDVFPHQIKYIWWQVKVYILSLGFSKLAILGLYPQISPSRTFTVLVWLLVGLVASCTLSALLWSVLGCLPVSNSWSLQAAVAQECMPHLSFVAFTGATNVATDLAILALPVMMMRHLTLPRKKKFGVAVVLATGSLASIISVVRMILSIRNMGLPDITYRSVDLVVWSSAEVHAVVICGCMPTLRPLIRLFSGHKTAQQSHGAEGIMEINKRQPTALNGSEITESDLETSNISNGSQDCRHSAGGADAYDIMELIPVQLGSGTHKGP